MNKNIDGKSLTSCFKAVAASGKEIQALSDCLNQLITEALSSDKNKTCVLNDKAIYDGSTDDLSGWAFSDIGYSFPLKGRGKGKQKTSAYIGYQISMMGDRIAAPGYDEPLLHVFLWEAPLNFGNEYYMGYPTSKGIGSQVINERLIQWNSENQERWPTHYWTFSLRLISLNSSEDLMRCVVNPTLALLRGEAVLSALPDSIEGLIRYPDADSIYEKTENEV